MRAARFSWKMPRYTTSTVRADIHAPPSDEATRAWSGGPTRRYSLPLGTCQDVLIHPGQEGRKGGSGPLYRPEHGPERRLHRVGRPRVRRPVALAQLVDDRAALLGRAVLGELELHARALDGEAEGRDVVQRALVHRVVRRDRAEPALGLIAPHQAHLLGGDDRGVLAHARHAVED